MELLKVNDHLYVPVDFESNHAYYADAEGKKAYTGVTTILGVLAKPALIGWSARLAAEYFANEIRYGNHDLKDETVLRDLMDAAKSAHTKKKDEAADFGTSAHALIERWINTMLEKNDGRPIDTPWGYEHIQPFTGWAIENVERFLFSERRMASEALWIAGTSDFGVVMKDGRKLIGDYKTSSGIYGIDYFLQGAAYKLLAEGEGDSPYDGVVIVRNGKKDPNDFEVSYRNANDVDEKAFLACLTIYRAQQTFVKPTKSSRP